MPNVIRLPQQRKLHRENTPLRDRAARAWLKRGAALVPLAERGKKPINQGGSRAPMTRSDKLEEFLAECPNANYGIVTGTISGLVVLDVDGPEGEKSLRALKAKYGRLPKTTTVMTGRGYHLYFRLPSRPIRNSAGRLGHGLDIRGEGGYVVGPGSVHHSGEVYEYAEGRGPSSVEAAEMPDWLVAILAGDEPEENPAAAQPDIAPEDMDRARRYAEAARQLELDRLRKAPVGQRNETLNRCAFKLGQLVAHELLDANAVAAELAETARLIGLEPAEIGPTIKSGLDKGQLYPRRLPFSTGDSDSAEAAPPPDGAQDSLTEELAALGQTDADNAERFARRFGHKVIYTPGKGFLAYDGTRWVRDSLLHSVKLAEETARLIAAETQYLEREQDRAARARFAEQSCSKGALDRMRELAKSRLAVEDGKLDSDRWLLNVSNGTVDLRTGELNEHDSRDFLTKLAPVEFGLRATCPTFEGFLRRILRDDEDLIQYVQKAVGYSLTGNTREQVLFLVQGPTKTGKSTLLNLIRDLVGDYGLNTPSETLLTKQYDNSIPADVARLAGARMVTSIEVNWNRQIDEAKVKAMTGGDSLTARHLYRDYFQFVPEFKLWFGVNDFPKARGTDGAFWERVRVIPFGVQIPPEDRDGQLTEKLKAESPGILAWAVRGCLKWQAEGLGTCEAVEQASGRWKKAADHLLRFVNEEVIIESGNFVQSHDLYARYRSWCASHGEEPLTDKKLKLAFEALDLTYKRERTGSIWKGIKLRLS